MEFVTLSSSFYWSFGLLILILLALSGLVSGAEVAFFSLDKTTLDEEDDSDQKIKTLLESPHQLLATILILNNLFNVFIVTLSTYASWQMVGQKEAEGVVLIALTAVISILIIFFGEIVPKISAAHQPQKFARFCLPYIWFFNRLLKPLSWLLIGLSRVIEKRIKKKGYNLSVEELNQALDITSERNVSKEEKGILKGIVNFGTLSVKQIMRSRVDISAIDRSSDFHELMDQINKTGFSRIPVYVENIDKIEGLLYIKDMLPFLHEEEDFHWQQFLRPVYFIPESKKIDATLKLKNEDLVLLLMNMGAPKA